MDGTTPARISYRSGETKQPGLIDGRTGDPRTSEALFSRTTPGRGSGKEG